MTRPPKIARQRFVGEDVTYYDYGTKGRKEAADDHIPGAYGDQDATCSARDRNRTWICTRVDGHAGRHEAGISNGSICASWPGDDDEAL